MSSKQMLAPIRITPDQKKWLEAEQKRTGNTAAVIIRGLISSQIEKKG
jgi:predicted DNA-binding protein